MTSSVFWTVFPLWIKAFCLTLLVEVPLFALIGKRFVLPNDKGAKWRLVLGAAAGTCLTHPLFWYVWPLVVTDYTWSVVSGELLIVVVESFTFFFIVGKIRLHQAALTSLVANGVSFAAGLLIPLF